MNDKPMLHLYPKPSETTEGTGAALRAGRTTCVRVLEHCFHQIDLWDGRVNAWVFVDRPGAMAQARALDAELAQGKCRGSLHGIPIGVKDIIDVAGMPTACGFAPWRDRVAELDATIVERLRKAGAVILGKTVTTQFAWIDPPPTRNPWNLDRTPGGSSSGSAAAVATGMCLGALGSQTGGSIIRPASFCGVAGLKPRYGSLPVDGVFPFAPSLDHPGPIARTVADLVLLDHPLDNLDEDDLDDDPLRDIEALELDVASLLDPITDPPVLLRPRGFFDRRADPEMLDTFEQALADLSRAGARIIDLPDGAIDFEGIVAKHRLIMAAEAAAGHESWYVEHRDLYARHIAALVAEGLSTPVTAYIRAHQEWGDAYRDPGIREPVSSTRLLVTPATIGPAPDTSTTGNPCFNSPFSFLQWPAISFPIGLSQDRMPLALQLAISVFGEPEVDFFGAALWCESVLRRAFEARSV
jgi:aspartyl-tRNA(Asn)/glutamyl-tRNA(Gln) amidotransferase subunit A